MSFRVREVASDPYGVARYGYYLLLGRTVCRVRGHRQDRTDRMLGVCGRCFTDIPTPESDAMWRGLIERGEP